MSINVNESKVIIMSVGALLYCHGSVLLLVFARDRVLTSEDKGRGGEVSGVGLERGTNSGGLTTSSLTSSFFSLFCFKCFSQWFTKVSSLTNVLLHTLQWYGRCPLLRRICSLMYDDRTKVRQQTPHLRSSELLCVLCGWLSPGADAGLA